MQNNETTTNVEVEALKSRSRKAMERVATPFVAVGNFFKAVVILLIITPAKAFGRFVGLVKPESVGALADVAPTNTTESKQSMFAGFTSSISSWFAFSKSTKEAVSNQEATIDTAPSEDTSAQASSTDATAVADKKEEETLPPPAVDSTIDDGSKALPLSSVTTTPTLVVDNTKQQDDAALSGNNLLKPANDSNTSKTSENKVEEAKTKREMFPMLNNARRSVSKRLWGTKDESKASTANTKDNTTADAAAAQSNERRSSHRMSNNL